MMVGTTIQNNRADLSVDKHSAGLEILGRLPESISQGLEPPRMRARVGRRQHEFLARLRPGALCYSPWTTKADQIRR